MTAAELEPRTPTHLDPPDFWDSLPVLQQIRQHARARRVSPWAVLGVVLARVVCTVKPETVLPPSVGSYASLNLFVAIVGRSGQGKGGAAGAAAELCQWNMPLRFGEANLGSGEGVAAAFARSARHDDGSIELDQHTDSVLFNAPEIDTLAALLARSGATLSAEMRKLWSGEPIGFNNRSADRSVVVPAHHYRAAAIIGVQPERSGVLLDDTAGGLAQRMLWFSAADPGAPDHAPEPVPPMIDWKPPTVRASADGKRVYGLCWEAKDEIETVRLQILRGEGDPLDGHRLLSRAKVAAALSLLAQSPVAQVTADDWRLAGIVLDESDQVRQTCIDALRTASHQANEARAVLRAEAVVKSDDHLVTQCANRIVSKLSTEWTSAYKIKNAMSQKLREYIEPAVYSLTESGTVEVLNDEYQGQKRTRYRLATSSGSAESPSLPENHENPRNHADLSLDNSGKAAPAESPSLGDSPSLPTYPDFPHDSADVTAKSSALAKSPSLPENATPPEATKPEDRACSECNTSLEGRRAHAKTCSPPCRKKLSAQNKETTS